MNWLHHTKIKHLMADTDTQDWQSIQDSMSAIANVLENDGTWFSGLAETIDDMRNIPDDRYAEDYANMLLDDLYDYADFYGIWIE